MVFSTTTREFQNGPRPDPIYALVVGLYACALLAPLGFIAVAGILTDVALFTLFVFATVAVVTAVVGSAAARTPGLAVKVGRDSRSWLLMAVPVVLFALLFGGAEAAITPLSSDSVVGWSLLGAMAGLFLGKLVELMSRTRYANTRLADETHLAQWDGWLPRRRRRIVSAFLTVGCLCVPAGLAVEELLGYGWGFALGQLAFTASLLVGVGRPNGRTFRVSDAGLTVENPIFRRLRPWSAFSGYTLTHDALSLHTAQWWRPTIRCDTNRIEEIDRVTDALDTHLPESGQ